MIARMQIRESAWNDLLAEYHICLTGAACDASGNLQSMLRNVEIQEIEAENPIGFVMLNCIGEESDIDELYNYFPAPDKLSTQPWKWGFNGKVNFATEYTGQHDDILATQPSGSSFEDPDWVNNWAGQTQNSFAREHSREYGEEFG